MPVPLRQVILIGLHVSLAVALCLWMHQRYQEREAEVGELAQMEVRERQAFEERQELLSVQRARLQGLDDKDPYVVELIAREKFGYQSPGEIKPPPMPTDD